MRRLPSFFSLRAFEAAARLGSFRRAGEELHQTPSAISHQVRSLESWFDRPLFVRQTRRVTLTAEGQRLLDRLTPAFDCIEEACAELRAPEQKLELAVHCAPSFAAKWLSPRLAHFMQAHPGITIRVSSSAEPADLQRVEDIDIDIAYGLPPAQPGVVVEALGREITMPMCSPRLIDGRGPIAPADLTQFTWIESPLNPVQWADWCALNGLKLTDRARPSFDRGSLAIAAAADGLGIALETTRFAQGELARGELVVLDGPGFRRIEREMHFLCYRKAERDSREIAAFREWLGAEMAADARGD
ncbi:MAG: LysR family transcriptional regulator [Methylibium sp.]|nr:LysR family transcriptional regulator [Methylibium sp.]